MPEIIEINHLEIEALKPYARTSEVQLLRYYEPQPGIFIAESPKVIGRALDAGYQPLSMLVERRLLDGYAKEIVERCGDIPIYTADANVLIQLTGYHLTKGVLCVMRRRALPLAETICKDAARIAVLEDVVNPTNVGAIFRSAAALHMDAVLLTPACSDPLYRRCVRVSMGTVFQIPWTYFTGEEANYVEELKNMGFTTAAMALKDDSVGIDHPELMDKNRLAIILGTEGEGLKDATIEACNYTVKIPMAHGVDSLNVAAASAVAFWQLGKKTR